MKSESNSSIYCLYPPRLSTNIDVTERTDAEGIRFVIRNRATSRYFLLNLNEHRIFQQFNGVRTLQEISQGDANGTFPRVSLSGLIKFLSKLEAYELLEYGGSQTHTNPTKPHQGVYPRIKLFNPDRLLNRLDNRLGWVFSGSFLAASLALFILTFFGLLIRVDEVVRYSTYTYSTYGILTVLLFTFVITVSHEFAHGLACKHFGGDVQEIGVLMIYSVLPALYCNVTDIYRIGSKRERLWVIAAGIYWQLFVSASAALVWLLMTPYTLLTDIMFLTFLGGTFTIIINCNPLFKLDGYYALSQLLGVQNLQAESKRYVGKLFARFFGESHHSPTARLYSQASHPMVFFAYYLLSTVYSVLFFYYILKAASSWFMDHFGLVGVLLTFWLAALLSKRWWKPVLNSLGVKPMSTHPIQPTSDPADQDKIISPHSINGSAKTITIRRSLVIKGALVVLFIVMLVMPWEASTGSDCTLLLPAGRENVARANISAVLSEVFVQPGDTVAEGAKLARLSNPDLEDRLTQIHAEIQRLDTNSTRLEDELRVRSELMLSANLKESDRKSLLQELKSESSQIRSAYDSNSSLPTSFLPASLAILQSELELKQTETDHNRREVERYKKLFDQGLIGAQIYDRSVATLRVSEKEVQAAKAKLESAIVEHRRSTSSLETSSLVAETEARAARSSLEILLAELHANRQQLAALRQRQDILKHEYDGLTVTATRGGVLLGEDLRKFIGKHFNTGEEICRIGELQAFQLNIEVNEREINYVKLNSAVRFKLKTMPDRVYTGRVSKIQAEPITNQNGQRFYPVEVAVDNSDGMLRPGMTGFARISFGRQAIGIIFAQKIWHSLRPELWLF